MQRDRAVSPRIVELVAAIAANNDFGAHLSRCQRETPRLVAELARQQKQARRRAARRYGFAVRCALRSPVRRRFVRRGGCRHVQSCAEITYAVRATRADDCAITPT